jgi:hypothetical protein
VLKSVLKAKICTVKTIDHELNGGEEKLQSNEQEKRFIR